jgi:hypothetical protein
MACLQRAITESHDLVIRRGTVGPTGQISAIDTSPHQMRRRKARCGELAWVYCCDVDIAAPPYGEL